MEESLPKSPLAKVLSSVAILLILISDGLLKPFVGFGISSTSVASRHWSWEVIKQTVKSSAKSARITAGLS